MAMRRGEIWWARLPAPWGRRPVLMLARNEAYGRLSWLTVAPLTSTIRNIPSEVPLSPQLDGIPQASAINLDHILSVHQSWLDGFIVHLRPERMQAVEQAIHFALALRT